MATRSYDAVTDKDIYINTDALKELGCKYIFSRIELTNASETNLILRGSYTQEPSPYTIYVYEPGSTD